MPHRVLITGVNGFSGRELAAQLRQVGHAHLAGSDLAPQSRAAVAEYVACDLTDPSAAERLVVGVRADAVYHLVGANNFEPPDVIHRVNVGGFLNLCAALRRTGTPVRLLTVGSAAELGRLGVARLPAPEEAPCHPESPYGQSKAHVTRLALAEPAGSPLSIVVVRPFNLIGPGMDTRLVLPNFALQLARIARGEADVLRCGDLESRRDFVDVRDAVAAYIAVMQNGRPGQVYNVCAGVSHRIGDLLDALIALAAVRPRVERDAARTRVADVRDVYGDRSKIGRDVGWRPTIGIGDSLKSLWEWARTQT